MVDMGNTLSPNIGGDIGSATFLTKQTLVLLQENTIKHILNNKISTENIKYKLTSKLIFKFVDYGDVLCLPVFIFSLWVKSMYIIRKNTAFN